MSIEPPDDDDDPSACAEALRITPSNERLRAMIGKFSLPVEGPTSTRPNFTRPRANQPATDRNREGPGPTPRRNDHGTPIKAEARPARQARQCAHRLDGDGPFGAGEGGTTLLVVPRVGQVQRLPQGYELNTCAQCSSPVWVNRRFVEHHRARGFAFRIECMDCCGVEVARLGG